MVKLQTPLYLTGFLKRRIRPESQKDSQNCGRKKIRQAAFTVFALTTPMVDFWLQTAHQPKATQNLPMSYIYRR
jgi:hypothetical protein